MDLILWIVFGAVAGWIASMIMGSRGGILYDIIFGIVGAVLGGWLMSFIGQPGVTGLNIYSLVVAVIGAMLVIWVARMFHRTA